MMTSVTKELGYSVSLNEAKHARTGHSKMDEDLTDKRLKWMFYYRKKNPGPEISSLTFISIFTESKYKKHKVTTICWK